MTKQMYENNKDVHESPESERLARFLAHAGVA